MPDKVIYTVILPEDSQQSESTESQRQISEISTLNADFGTVTSTGSLPSQFPVSGQFRGVEADGMARELAELASNDDIKEVPVYSPDTSLKEAGYYTVESGTANQVDPRSPNLQRYEAVLKRVGSEQSHFRAIETSVVNVNNPFGSQNDTRIGIPAEATGVRWYDERNGNSEVATVETTRTTEFGDVAMYSPIAASFGDPMLIYTLPYDREGYTDARVYDASTPTREVDGNRMWQRVFSSTHDFDGRIVLTNGQMRVFFDEQNNEVSYQRWNNGWSAETTLSDSTANDWGFRDLTLRYIGPSRIEVQARMRDGQNIYSIDLSMRRGWDDIFVLLAANEDTAPTGVRDFWQEAADGVYGRDAQGTQTVRPRTEVAK